MIKKLWNIDKNESQFSHLMDFVTMVVNTSISSFKNFNRFTNDTRFEALDMLEIAKNVHPTINVVVSGFDLNMSPDVIEIMTEKGVCYSVNSVLGLALLNTKCVYN